MSAGKGLGTAQIGAAIGIGAWWVYWFGSGAYATKQPLSDRIYENSFPVADLTFAALLVVAGLAWHGRLARHHAIAGLFAGGMGLALATIDTFHNLLVGAFHGASIATLLQKVVFAVVNAGVGAASGFLTWRDREHLGVRSVPVPSDLWLLGISVAMAALYSAWAGWGFSHPQELDATLKSQIAPAVLALLAYVIAAGVSLRAATRPLAWPLLVATAGMVAHRALLILLLAVNQRVGFVETVLNGAFLVAVLAATVPALRSLFAPEAPPP